MKAVVCESSRSIATFPQPASHKVKWYLRVQKYINLVLKGHQTVFLIIGFIIQKF